jgi:RHS repeat-associated protein
MGSFAGHAQRDRRHAGEGKHGRAMCRRHREDWGWQVSRTLPMGQQEQMSYNAGRELVSHVDFMGRTTLHEYDLRGRRIRTTHPDGRITQASYDAAGRRIALSEGSNSWSWQYDARDRVTQLTQPAGVVSYEYDLAGNRTRTTSANQVVSYGFDALNRLSTVRTGTPSAPPTDSTPAHQYAYAANGLRTAEVRPNGTRTEYAYNVRNHVTSVLHKAATGSLLLGLSYAVDATGLRNSITETVDGGALNRITAYQYDANKRLIREEITRAGQTGTQVTSWVYDRLPSVASLRSGNRLSQTVDGATLSYTYDANDRLLTESDGTSHVYDNNSNLVRTEKGNATQRYSWDSSGRLSEHTDASGIRTAYAYDPDRIRVSRTSRLGEADAERTAYLIDYLQPYAQVLEEAVGPATSSVLSHQVAYVHGDDLIAQVRGGVAQHYHYDALGSTRLLSGADGAVSDRYAYTAYGELDAAGSSVVSENAYRYTGEQFDSGLGMYYLRARYMDPARGRFVGMDPWRGDISAPITQNKFLYASGSPAYFVDPTGLYSIPETMAGININIGGRIVSAQLARRYVKRAVTQSIQTVGSSRKAVKKCIMRRGSCDLDVPVLVIGGDLPELADHIQDAQLGLGSNLVFSGLMFSYRERQGDRSWYNKTMECSRVRRELYPNRDCDEFPMFTTNRGGPANHPTFVSLRLINSSQNQRGGALWGGLVTSSGMRSDPKIKALVVAWREIPISVALPLNRM